MNSYFKPIIILAVVFFLCSILLSCNAISDINLPEGMSERGGLLWAVSEGEASVTGYNGADPNITVPSTYEGNPVTSINEKAFRGKTYITSVTLPDSITRIGSEAFSGCTSLNKVNIPSGITTIAEHTFYDCKSLSSITIPESVTTVESGAFFRCESLTSVYYEGTIDMWIAICFKDYDYRADSAPCNNGADLYIQGELLTVLVIPDGTEAIPERVFAGCKSIDTVIIPKSVTTINKYAFFNCSVLKTVKYTGTKDEWKTVFIDNKNTLIRKAEFTYKFKMQ